MEDKMKKVIMSSFIKGVGSTIYFGTVKRRRTISEFYLNSDTDVLREDWVSVGKDLELGLQNYGNRIKRKTIEGFSSWK